MLIYILLLFAFIGIYLIGKFFIKDEKKRQLFCSLCPAILLFLLLSLKASSVGADSQTYVNAYYAIGGMHKFPSREFFTDLNHFNFKNEYGFIFFSQLFNMVKLPYLAMQVFVYAVICFSLFYSVYKLSRCPVFSFIIFYCFTFFNFFVSGLRQSFAISLCLLALTLIISGGKTVWRTVVFFSLITIAALWHKSAIIFFLAYFIIRIRVNLKMFIVLIFISLFLLLFAEQMYQFINSFSGLLFNTKVADYAPFSAGNGLTNILFIGIILFCFFISYPSKIKTKLGITLSEKIKFFNVEDSVVYSREIQEDFTLLDNFSFMLLMTFVGLWLRYTNLYSVAFGRVSIYFSIFVIFLLPNSVENIRNFKIKGVLKIILFIAFAGYFAYTVIRTNYLAIAPYKFLEGTI